MNKAHRVVWSEARGAFIVAHELAATGGKRSSTKTAIAASVAAAMLVLAGAAEAQTTTISAPANSQFPAAGQSLLNSSVITGTSGYAGVNVNGVAAGGVTNTGTIQGSTAAGEQDPALKMGVIVNTGGALTAGITNSGTTSLITGLTAGVVVKPGSSVSVIINQGTISASSTRGGGILMKSASTIGSITNSGFVGGGQVGIAASASHIGSVTNSGTISGSLYGIAIGTTASVGSITNLAGGMISGDVYGIAAQGGSSLGTVSNAAGAAIFGNSAGIFVDASTIATVINAGTILGVGTAGILLKNGASIGSITNSGTIAGTNGLSITSASHISSIVNQSGGTISGTQLGISLSGASSVGSIVNAAGATIIGPNQGIVGTQGTIGSIVNAGTIIGSQYSGIELYEGFHVGSITNSGTILGHGTGIYLDTTALTGGITNSGLISGPDYDAIGLFETSLSGGINNLRGGVISGASGITIGDGTVLDNITNAAGATIVGLGGGAGSGIAGISIYSSTITGKIVNAGLITGDIYGIFLASQSTIAGAIVNSGSINGTNYAGIILRDASTVGSITNSGRITGDDSGIAVLSSSSVPNGIVNTGVISGSASNRASGGILAAPGSKISTISNAAGATISGGYVGVELENTATPTAITDAGVISGGTYSVLSFGSVGASVTITGANTASFLGDVVTAANVTVTSGSTFTGTNAFNVKAFDVDSGATFNFGTMDSIPTTGDNNGVTVTQGLNNAGTVSVGLTKATLTGNYTQAGSGVFSLGASSGTSYGQMVASGTAVLPANAGIFVNVAPGNTLTNKETLTGVIESTGLTASTFVVTDNSSIYNFKGVVDGNNVDLVLSLGSVLLPATIARGNVDAEGAAALIDGIITTSGETGAFGTIVADIGKLESQRDLSHAASQLLPVLSGEGNIAILGALYQMNSMVQARNEGDVGISTGMPAITDRGVWVKPFGSWADLGNTSSAPGFSSGVEGVMIGGDAALSNQARVGLAFGYANIDASGNADSAPNQDRINMYQLMGYGSYTVLPGTEVNLQLDGGENTNDSTRSIAFAGSTAKASYNSSNAHFGIGVAHPFALSDTTTIVPSARVDYTWVQTDGYQEGGAGPLDLQTNSTSYEQLLTSINGRLVQKVNDYMTVFGNLGFGYDSMARDNTAIVSTFAGAPGESFTTEGVGLKPRVLLAGFGVTSLAHGMTPEVSARYDAERRTNYSNQTVSFKARWAF